MNQGDLICKTAFLKTTTFTMDMTTNYYLHMNANKNINFCNIVMSHIAIEYNVSYAQVCEI